MHSGPKAPRHFSLEAWTQTFIQRKPLCPRSRTAPKPPGGKSRDDWSGAEVDVLGRFVAALPGTPPAREQACYLPYQAAEVTCFCAWSYSWITSSKLGWPSMAPFFVQVSAPACAQCIDFQPRDEHEHHQRSQQATQQERDLDEGSLPLIRGCWHMPVCH